MRPDTPLPPPSLPPFKFARVTSLVNILQHFSGVSYPSAGPFTLALGGRPLVLLASNFSMWGWLSNKDLALECKYHFLAVAEH